MSPLKLFIFTVVFDITVVFVYGFYQHEYFYKNRKKARIISSEIKRNVTSKNKMNLHLIQLLFHFEIILILLTGSLLRTKSKVKRSVNEHC